MIGEHQVSDCYGRLCVRQFQAHVLLLAGGRDWLVIRMSVPFARIGTPQQNASNQFERPVDVKTAACFLGVSASQVCAYVERKQIPHYRMMGRSIRSDCPKWPNGGANST